MGPRADHAGDPARPAGDRGGGPSRCPCQDGGSARMVATPLDFPNDSYERRRRVLLQRAGPQGSTPELHSEAPLCNGRLSLWMRGILYKTLRSQEG